MRKIFKKLFTKRFLFFVRQIIIIFKLITVKKFIRKCSICNFEGYFGFWGMPPRLDALCPNCRSVERHRLFGIWYSLNKKQILEPVLHFAPEEMLSIMIKKDFKNYKSADLYEKADLKIDIEKIDLKEKSVGTVICNQVIEHVNDEKALKELHRILKRNGLLILSTPIIEGWTKTYEDPNIVTPDKRFLHFGQSDHLRYYGSDFRERLNNSGFTQIEEMTAKGKDVIKYGLIRGEKIFICKK